MKLFYSRKMRRLFRACPLASALLFMALAVKAGAAFAAEKTEDFVERSATTSCVSPAYPGAASSQEVLLLAAAVTLKKENKSQEIAPEELGSPMKEKELQLLIRALEPVRLKDGKSVAIRAMVEGTELPFKRAALLAGDAKALLLNVRTRSALERLKKNPNANKAALAWFAYADQAVSFCARQRFEGRGGMQEYERAFGLVERFQERLAPVILYDLNAEVFAKVIGLDKLPEVDVPRGGMK